MGSELTAGAGAGDFELVERTAREFINRIRFLIIIRFYGNLIEIETGLLEYSGGSEPDDWHLVVYHHHMKR